ncbi:hypothetical protein GQ457_12G001320 [Hibiscus cannabinus]
MRAAAVFRVDAIVRGRRNSRVSTPSTEGDRLVYNQLGDMRAAAVFRVDAIVRVSTPSTRETRLGCTSRDKTYQKRKKKKFIKRVIPVELTPYKFVGCYDQYESNAPSLRTFKSNVPKSFASHKNGMLNDHYINV